MRDPVPPAPPNETGTGCGKRLLWSVALLIGAGFWAGQNEWLEEVPVHLAAQRVIGQIDAATYERLLGQHRLAELGWVAAWVLLWGAGLAGDAVWTRRRGRGRQGAGIFMLIGLTVLLAGCGPAVPTVTPVGAP